MSIWFAGRDVNLAILVGFNEGSEGSTSIASPTASGGESRGSRGDTIRIGISNLLIPNGLRSSQKPIEGSNPSLSANRPVNSRRFRSDYCDSDEALSRQ